MADGGSLELSILFLVEKCSDSHPKKHDSFNLYRKVKESAGMYKSQRIGRLIDNEGRPVIGQKGKMQKAPGSDEIQFLKLLDDIGINWPFNWIYGTKNIPQDWFKSKFITIPKKNHQNDVMKTGLSAV